MMTRHLRCGLAALALSVIPFGSIEPAPSIAQITRADVDADLDSARISERRRSRIK